MKLSPKQRKWVKRLLILLVIRFGISGLLYYIVVYRFKDLAQIAVKKESHGLYTFDASAVEFSLWKKSLIIEDAVLRCNDTVNTRLHHDLLVPRIYLSILSWSDLVFHRKMEIDSMDILLPALRSHAHGDRSPDTSNLAAKDSAGFQASVMLSMMQNLLTHLQVRVLDVRDGSFAYSNTKNNIPFLSNRINFLIRNFKTRANRRDHLFSSDDVDLSIEDQQWQLPDGIHSLSFKRLHFSGRNQFFEMDSCHLHTAAIGDKEEISFTADKLFFNSSQLSSIYERGELLIDSLICFHPVLHLPNPNRSPSDKHDVLASNNDSLLAANRAIRNIFRNINFKYIDIREGQLILGAMDASQAASHTPTANDAAYGTQKTNLRIYNLRILPNQEHPVTTDSVQLSLQKIQFLTRDSLFQLAIEELVLHNNDVVFKNASFGPTDRNHSGKSMHFTTPMLRLKDISLEDLVNKKLKATQAELFNPVITFSDKGNNAGKTASRPASLAPPPSSKHRSGSSSPAIAAKDAASDAPAADSLTESKKFGRDISHFYENLHALGELIDVPDFRIVDGHIHYLSAGPAPLSIKMNKLNAEIYLDHFLTSDSLIDIKRSMPQLSVKEIAVESEAVNLRIEDYHFRGTNRHNGAAHIHLALQNGTVLDGKDLYWEILDWDQYQKYRIVMIEALKARQLTINIKKTPPAQTVSGSQTDPPGSAGSSTAPGSSTAAGTTGPRGPRKNLPVIHIGRLDIDRLTFTSSSPDGSIRLEGRELCVDEINTGKRSFVWENMQGRFDTINFRKKNITASAGNVFFDNESETSLHNVQLDIRANTNTPGIPADATVTRVRIPRLRLNLPLHSTNPAEWQALSLTMDQPDVEVHATRANSAKTVSASQGTPDSPLVSFVKFQPQKAPAVNGLPFKIRLDKIDINKAHFHYLSEGTKDTMTLAAELDLHLKDLQTFAREERLFQYDFADLDISALRLNKGMLNLHLPHSTLRLEKGSARKNEKNKWTLQTGLFLNWYDASLKTSKSGKMELALQNLSGSFRADNFSTNRTPDPANADPSKADAAFPDSRNPDKKFAWLPLLDQITLREGTAFYKSANLTLRASSLEWQPQDRTFSLGSFSMTPNLSMEETFKKEGAWQSDYMTASGDLINIRGLELNQRAEDSSLSIRKIELEGVSLTTFRDKRMPFKHGQEKPMPTKLINTIPYPLRIDSVIVRQSNVTVNEIAITTKKQGTIPLQNINATITHINNRNNDNDSLSITASLQLLNNNIRYFHYKEAYADSLSAYRVSLNASPMELPSFNKATVPLASVNVEQGQSDTLFAQWAGDKYAAFGSMNFHYKELRVKLLDPANAERKSFLLALENALANSLILHKSNTRESYVFFERDREKFVFNYWVKSALKGTLSSIGLKSNKKYLRQYKKLRKTYPIPKTPDASKP